MAEVLTDLAELIASGLADGEGKAKPVLEALFGGRYYQRFHEDQAIRDRLNTKGGFIPFAGLIHPSNPMSGVYGGASVVWFPVEGHGSILTFVVGTAGLPPDEGLLSRPGHRRRVRALQRYLAGNGVWAWAKPDPTALGVALPDFVKQRLSDFEDALRRYGNELYAIAEVPAHDIAKARLVVQAFFDLYAYERGWLVLKAHEEEFQGLINTLRSDLFARVDEEAVYQLLRDRRFVILQGPPGTGKTRMAERIKRNFFQGKGLTVQFHPAVTYEDFIIGLSPDTTDRQLHFDVRPGWLLEAARAADELFLLVIDEINRADLGKVLGEAIYLFEAKSDVERSVELPYQLDGTTRFKLPPNLHVLGTMNTADRSIAPIDLAIRRRFSFVDLAPDISVIEHESVPIGAAVFGALQDVFAEYAPDDALDLLPGHSFFLAQSNEELQQRFRYELLPLIDEYLRAGIVASLAAELQAVRDQIEGFVDHGAWID